MSNDPWLRELAQVAKQDQEEERNQLDGRWDRLSAGELSPDEEAELRALAETSPEAREAYQAFQPLGPEFQARVVQSIRDRREKEKAPARVLPFFRRLPPLRVWLPAAAAAGIALTVMFRSSTPLPPLPEYAEVTLSGGTRTVRGPEETSRYHAGDPFGLVVRPETEVRGKVDARCCVLNRGEESIPWTAVAHIAASGAVSFQGNLPQGIAAGDWTLCAAVGRPGEVPEEGTQWCHRAGTPARNWKALKVALKID